MNLDSKEIKTLLLSDEDTFLEFLEKFYDKISREKKVLPEWIDETTAMNLLGIKSKTTLWKLRSEGKIAYSQMGKKLILYRRSSIINHIEQHEQKTF